MTTEILFGGKRVSERVVERKNERWLLHIGECSTDSSYDRLLEVVRMMIWMYRACCKLTPPSYGKR
jgi:hypothetical protein